MKTLFVILCGIIGVIYLINPTAGIIEFIPDNFPIVGNLDEAVASGLVINCLAYFGINLVPFARRGKKEESRQVQGNEL